MADDVKKTAWAVLSPLRHDGKSYLQVEGKTVRVLLTDEEAESLKLLGVIGATPVAAKPAPPAA